MMEHLRRARGPSLLLAASLLCATRLQADPIVSVTAPPALSTLISSDAVVSTSWSASNAYTDVSIAVLVNSSLVGETPTANAYLTSRIGPGTTVNDEIAHTQFTVPVQLPVCSSNSCGAMVTLFSGLSLGPGDYFLTLSSTATSSPVVGWFPALDPIVVTDAGVTLGASFLGSAVAAYPAASAFGTYPFAMQLVVTGEPATAIPESPTAILIGLGVLVLRTAAPRVAKRDLARDGRPRLPTAYTLARRLLEARAVVGYTHCRWLVRLARVGPTLVRRQEC